MLRPLSKKLHHLRFIHIPTCYFFNIKYNDVVLCYNTNCFARYLYQQHPIAKQCHSQYDNTNIVMMKLSAITTMPCHYRLQYH